MDGSDYVLEPLTQREGEILGLLAEELSNREIAKKLSSLLRQLNGTTNSSIASWASIAGPKQWTGLGRSDYSAIPMKRVGKECPS